MFVDLYRCELFIRTAWYSIAVAVAVAAPTTPLAPTASLPRSETGRGIDQPMPAIYWNATSAKLRSLRLCNCPMPWVRSSSMARMPMRRCWSTRSR